MFVKTPLLVLVNTQYVECGGRKRTKKLNTINKENKKLFSIHIKKEPIMLIIKPKLGGRKEVSGKMPDATVIDEADLDFYVPQCS